MLDHEKIREYDEISPRGQELLRREEGLDVEFKQSLDALDVTDIVAFANSPNGGTILAGISEEHLPDGRQKGVIHGLRIGDKAKMQIVGKINNIVPQLEIDIIVENKRHKPFYRLEIPSGPNKPYCTTSGIYKIRDDGYSKPLFPNTMLDMFLEKESKRFLDRFDSATNSLEEEIRSTGRRAAKELDDLEQVIRKLSSKTDAILERLGIESEDKKDRDR